MSVKSLQQIVNVAGSEQIKNRYDQTWWKQLEGWWVLSL